MIFFYRLGKRKRRKKRKGKENRKGRKRVGKNRLEDRVINECFVYKVLEKN